MHYFVSFLVCNHLEEEERELVALLLLSYECVVTVCVLCMALAYFFITRSELSM